VAGVETAAETDPIAGRGATGSVTFQSPAGGGHRVGRRRQGV